MKKFAAILALILIVSCASPNTRPVTFGAVLTLTGFASMWGENAQNGMELAREEINAAGGINGKPLEIIYEDYKDLDLKLAATAAQRFTSVDKVNVILTQFTGDTEVVYPTAKQNNIITLDVAGGAKDLTKKGLLLFRVWPSDELLVKNVVDYAFAHGAKTAAILGEDEAYFNSLRAINEEYWEEKTGTKLSVYVVPLQTTDLRTPLSKIKEQNPDVLFFQTTTLLEGLALKQAKEIGLSPRLMIGIQTSDDPTVITTAQDAAEGLVYPDYAPSSSEFIQKYTAKYGKASGVPADAAYDAVNLLANVMREHGTSTEQIAAGLYATTDYPGASGSITIDETGDRVSRDLVLKVIRNGKGEVLK